MSFSCVLLTILAVCLAACTPLQQVLNNPTETSPIHLSPTISIPTSTTTPESNSTIIVETPAPSATPEILVPTIIETGEVLRFIFPTPGQAPVSIWRPPLYPVPWGLGPNDHFLFTRPIAADVVNWALPNYRYGGIFTGTDIVHTGIDIDAPIETPVYASGSGTIRWAGFGLYMNDTDKNDPYGLAVVIEHDFGYKGQKLFTVYAHLDRVDVNKGQYVRTGDQIGIVGNTGNTTGPHLHFELRVGDNNYYTSRNPELWLSPPQGWGVLVGRVMWSDGTLLEKKALKVKSLSSEQAWDIITYGPLAVNPDDTYHENLVLSDLPQGDYQVNITFFGRQYSHTFSIQPGAVTYLTFRGIKGFMTSILPTPEPDQWFLTPIPTP